MASRQMKPEFSSVEETETEQGEGEGLMLFIGNSFILFVLLPCAQLYSLKSKIMCRVVLGLILDHLL